MKRLVSPLIALFIAAAFAVILPAPAMAAPGTITNPFDPLDNLGGSVDAHGGGVIKVGTYYYWFGENRNADNSFRYVSVYRSTNLIDWEFRGNPLTQASAPELNSANIERPKVIYNAATNRFVMWMHKESATDYNEARTAVASSATVDGDYTYHGSFRPLGNMSRDIGLFTENGDGYMYSAANNNRDLHIYKLTSDYLGISSLIANPWPGASRESPVLFKRNGVYFMLTSGTTGWNPNPAMYATATNIAGPWTAMSHVGDSTTFGSQPTYVLPIQGTSTTSYMYMGDRWAGAWKRPVNESQYVWLPLAFPTNTTLSMIYSSQITVDTATGTVTGNNTFQRITNRNSGLVADVLNKSTADGGNVAQYTWNGGNNQQWDFQDAGEGYFRIVNRNSGKCLEVNSNSQSDGANINQWACGGSNSLNQQWKLEPVGSYFQMRARHSNKCADVTDSSTANGANIMQWTCNGGNNQQWTRS